MSKSDLRTVNPDVVAPFVASVAQHCDAGVGRRHSDNRRLKKGQVTQDDLGLKGTFRAVCSPNQVPAMLDGIKHPEAPKLVKVLGSMGVTGKADGCSLGVSFRTTTEGKPHHPRIGVQCGRDDTEIVVAEEAPVQSTPAPTAQAPILH